MAKTAYSIKMDYNNAIKQAEKLEKLARDLKQIAQTQLQECLSNVDRSWKSTSSVKYINKGKKLREEILSRAKNLEKTAETIRTIAKNVYDAEMRSLEIAKRRTYSG